MAKCKICSNEIEGYKCEVCGEEADELTDDFKQNHACGQEHVMPMCSGCGEAELRCSCTD